MAAGPKPKLLSHVNEACTAIFAIEKVEYSGHMLLTDHRCELSKIPRRLACTSELDHILAAVIRGSRSPTSPCNTSASVAAAR
jgi:hypothetical protein